MASSLRSRVSQLLAKIKKRLLRKIKKDWPVLYGKIRGLVPYSKPILSSADIVNKLKGAQLTVLNTAAAVDCLDNINYYRFKIYLRPFLSSYNSHIYNPGAKFEDALELHEFDRHLRSFIFELTSEIEILLRHRIDTRINNFSNNPFWYINPNWYRKYPVRTLDMIRSSSLRSREDFAEYFHSKYHSGKGGKYHLLPPFWMASELLTMGQLHYLISSLDKSKFAQPSPGLLNELDRLARDFDAYNIQNFVKWMEYLRNLRNYCAHHNRLWNRNLPEPPGTQRKLSVALSGIPPTKHRLYHHLVMIRAMMKSRNVPDGISPMMQSLFAKFPVALANMSHMGFPPNWSQDPFW